MPWSLKLSKPTNFDFQSTLGPAHRRWVVQLQLTSLRSRECKVAKHFNRYALELRWQLLVQCILSDHLEVLSSPEG
jgi:hypothetical protein